MNDKDKELLLRDLCGRLPYGVKCEWYRYRPDRELIHRGIIELGKNNKDTNIFDCWNKFKPYLFPLSSMTKEQSKIYHELIGGMFGTGVLINLDCLIDFFNENHLDLRGLIPLGLAIDATNKNIY